MNILFLFTTLISTLFSSENPELIIKVSNIEKIKGEIKIGVFNKETNFLKEIGSIRNYAIKVNKSTAFISITDLPKGEYAISMYHDENSDNECNRNFMGIPKEAYGFSNNFKPKFGPPKYKDCKFTLLENKTLNIEMIN
ncbi:DUF2141 domain-containing protein [Flavobacterium sp. GP15]|uniref:DUF2141 domain-containing protein n=1 Tax=Flavobacterium sp. GP15 TaxID=2758567 RepID=UPI00165E7FA0|nr:DUF2141 domain-containing protein [Flavobacterium sp. GP15]